MQKLNKLPFLGTVDMSGFHQKPIIQLVEVLILMNSIMNSILQRHCKLVTLITLRMLDHAHHHALHFFMIMPITLSKTLMPKVLKSTWRKPWCLSASKQSISSLTSFCKLCILGTLGMLDHTHQKISISIFSSFHACKKSIASLTSFSACCKEIANLLL